MNRRQRESVARYFYDLSKLTLAVTVLGNIASRERFEFWVVCWGLVAAFSMFIAAYAIEGTLKE